MKNWLLPELKIAVVAFAAMHGAFAYEDLGPMAKVKSSHPFIFIPDEVNKLSVNGEERYVFAGQAEKFLDDETDSELWQEAELSAKKSFYNWWAKGDSDAEVTFSGCSPMYRDKAGKVYTIVLSVPSAKVAVNKKVRPAPAKSVVVNMPAEVKPDKVADVAETATAPEAVAIATPADEISTLRDAVTSAPKDWKLRWKLARAFCANGSQSRGLRHYRVAVQDALADQTADSDSTNQLLFEAAQKFDSVNDAGVAMKFYRLILHRQCQKDMRKVANARIAALLMKNDLL